jgi:hypothetical protein
LGRLRNYAGIVERGLVAIFSQSTLQRLHVQEGNAGCEALAYFTVVDSIRKIFSGRRSSVLGCDCCPFALLLLDNLHLLQRV